MSVEFPLIELNDDREPHDHSEGKVVTSLTLQFLRRYYELSR
jgi:hypothetical protein